MKYGLFFAAMIGLNPLWAQLANDDSGTELLKPFKAKLAESQKFDPTPIVPKLDEQERKQEYNVPSHLKELKYPAPVLTPLPFSTKKDKNQVEVASFYAKIGFGYPISPLAELSYHSQPAKNYRYGATFKHHSGQGNYNLNQRFSNTGLNLGGAYFTKNNLAVDGNLGFNLRGNRFYGYGDSLDLNDSTAVKKDSVNQRFTEIYANVGVFNSNLGKNNLNYKATLGFYRLSDLHQASEISVSPNLALEKFIGKKNLKHSFAADLGLNYVSFSDTIATDTNNLANRLLFYFKPNFNYNGGAFRVKIGANVGSSEGKFYALPDIAVSGLLLKGKITAYAGWKGEIKQNNFRSLSLYNPFIVSALTMRHTKQQDFYGGVKGSVQKVNYDAKVAYSRAQNLPLFLNDSLSNYRKFSVLFDTANIFSLSFAADMEIKQNLRLSATAAYNVYSFNNVRKAYHLPVLETNISLQYTQKKLQLKAELYANAGVAYFDEISRTDKRLGGLFDLNLYGSYFFHKNIAAFVSLNNILNNQNQRWFRYPQIGFNAMGGIIAKF